MYAGSCCFHRRDCLNGRIYSELNKIELNMERPKIQEASIGALEKRTKNLATCSYEENTQWGKEMDLKYGCPVEDVITGFSIQCRGWKSAYFSPKIEHFLDLAPTTLSQALVQHKRWSEAFAAFRLSTPFLLSMLSSLLFAFLMEFSYSPANGVSLWESLIHGLTLKCWWNDKRMWLYRTTSDLLALVDTILKLLDTTDSTFVITLKVADEETSKRYEKKMTEFGSTLPIFTILSTIAMLNLFCFFYLIGGIRKVIMDKGVDALGSLFLQFLLCGSLALINLPIFDASFFRNDKGRIPMSTTLTSVAIVTVAYFIFISK